MEIDALLDGTAFPLPFSKAWCKELNMDYFRNAKVPSREAVATEASTCAVHDVVHVISFTRKRSLFFVAGRHSAVHGVEDSWCCDDEADRSYHSNTHEKRATNHTVR